MRSQIYTTIAGWAERRPWIVLGICLLVTLFSAMLASSLELNMQFKNMMPESHPTVQEYDRIIQHYSSASNLIVVIRGPEEQIKRFADELAPGLESMDRYFRRVDLKLDTDFLGRHGFMLAKAKDLENTQGQFSDLGLLPFLTHLNDAFEKTYVADSESISSGEKEDKAVAAVDGISVVLGSMQSYVDGTGRDVEALSAADRFLVGDPYFISPDKDMLLVFAQPTFTVNDVNVLVSAVNAVDSLIAGMQDRFPEVDAGPTGTIALARDEMVAVTADMYITTMIAFVLIIALFIVSFRMWVAPVLAGISLITGVIWAAGISALTVGSLNMMTSMFAVILVGLGIDYNIHVISGYTEFRSEGSTIGESIRQALTKTGNGIVIGSLSTALAFLTMLISENRGMKEFALVAGLGVLFCMLSSLFVLPSLLVVRDRVLMKRSKSERPLRSITYAWTGKLAENIARRPVSVIAVLTVVTGALLYSAFQITFDYNYLNLEPKGLLSIELQDAVIDEFDVTPDMVLVTASSVEESRTLAESAKALGSVGMVTAISDFVPSERDSQDRVPFIEQIRTDLERGEASLLEENDLDDLEQELFRVEDNLIELAQLAFVGGQEKVDRKVKMLVGDLEQSATARQSVVAELVASINRDRAVAASRLRAMQSVFEPVLRTKALRMTSVNPIGVADLPEDILSRFVSDDGSQYLVSIYPREQVWDFEFLGRFTEQMHRIDPRVTGLPPIFYVLIDYIGRDGRTAAMLAAVIIFLLLWIDFGKFTLASMAMTSLAVGAVWMVGLMNLFGMQFNLVNTIGIPLILGIGIDDAVHILNRRRVEGPGHLYVVFASTGKAVILTSLTTMIAFGSLGFAVYRGLGSLGITLMIGVGTALITTLLMLPALLGLYDRKRDASTESSPTRAIGKEGTILFLACCLGLACISDAQAQDQATDVLDIIRRVDTNERLETSRSTGRQIITTSSGSERILEMESFAVGMNEKMLTVYTGPARVRGDKILMLNDGDDIWFYTPKTDRVRHLASHARRQKVQGSDFSYEDMISGNLEGDYTHRLLEEVNLEGIPCFVVESVPTDSGPSYSKIVIWIDKDRYVTRRVDYYEGNDLLKRLVTEDIRDLSGHWVPFRLRMTNLQDGGKTVLEFEEMEINVDLDEGMFTTNSLSRR